MFSSSSRELARVTRERDDAIMGLQIISMIQEGRSTRKPDLSRPVTVNPKPAHEFVQDAVQVGLQRLLDKSFFSISDLSSLLESARIVPDGSVMKALRPLHCMDWSDMDPEFRVETQQQILAMFVPVEAETTPQETPDG